MENRRDRKTLFSHTNGGRQDLLKTCCHSAAAASSQPRTVPGTPTDAAVYRVFPNNRFAIAHKRIGIEILAAQFRVIECNKAFSLAR